MLGLRSFPVTLTPGFTRLQLRGTTSGGGAGIAARRRRIRAMNDLVSAFRLSSAYTGCEARTSAASWLLLARTIRAWLSPQKAAARRFSVGEVAITCLTVSLAACESAPRCSDVSRLYHADSPANSVSVLPKKVTFPVTVLGANELPR